MGKVPSYNSLKACQGTMFLPLDKTLQTIEDVENNTTVPIENNTTVPIENNTTVPDPELYILISGKPSKNKVLWQSLVNVDQVKAAVQKLRSINWLYANVNDSSIDDASQRIVECVSNTSSKMLVKASAEDVSSFQACRPVASSFKLVRSGSGRGTCYRSESGCGNLH